MGIRHHERIITARDSAVCMTSTGTAFELSTVRINTLAAAAVSHGRNRTGGRHCKRPATSRQPTSAEGLKKARESTQIPHKHRSVNACLCVDWAQTLHSQGAECPTQTSTQQLAIAIKAASPRAWEASMACTNPETTRQEPTNSTAPCAYAHTRRHMRQRHSYNF